MALSALLLGSLLVARTAAQADNKTQGQGFKPGKIPDSWLDPEAKPAVDKGDAALAARRAEFAQHIANKAVLLVRVAQAWHPRLGTSVQSCADGWLAFQGNKMLGYFESSLLPKDVKIAATQFDAAGMSAGAWLTPGLVDANSHWFRDSADLGDSKADATTQARQSLVTWQEDWEQLLVRGGVTKLWVPASLRGSIGGQGALLDLVPSRGPRLATRKSALDIRISTPGSSGSSLARNSAAEGLKKQFEAAKKHREAQEKFDKELEEYKKKRKEFLAYYKKNPLKPGQKAPSAASSGSSRGRSGTRTRFRPTPEQMAELRKLPPQQRMAAMRKMMQEAAAKANTAKKPEPKKEEKGGSKKAPPRPKYPKKPKDNPVLDELLRVLDGKLAVRVEAHRKGEILALIELMNEFDIRDWTLLGATEAYDVAKQLRQGGVPVVLMPQGLDPRRFDAMAEHMPQLAAKLANAGVEVSLATASKDASADLRLLAARAVAWGMKESDALAAISANALRSTPGGGSEDVVVWSGHPLDPASRPIAIVRNGKLSGQELLQKNSQSKEAAK
jgi:imidazolonepropionase-like amidohydrolase